MKRKLSRTIGLDNYTPQEIEIFGQIHKILTEYNARIGTDNEMPMPKYGDDEMAEYSGYRQMVIAKECED